MKWSASIRLPLNALPLAWLLLIVLIAPLSAQPWRQAEFRVSSINAIYLNVICETCPTEWKDALVSELNDRSLSSFGFNDTSDDDTGNDDAALRVEAYSGHIIEIDLTWPTLSLRGKLHNPNGWCAGEEKPVVHYSPQAPMPVPVVLETVPDWHTTNGTTLTFSGSVFKFSTDGVRAEPFACGEMVGVNLVNGVLDWPPENRPDLMREPFDNNPQFPADALIITADRTAHVIAPQLLEDLSNAYFGISGSYLYREGNIFNPTPGTNPDKNIARLVAGVLNGRQKLLFIMIEHRPGNNMPGASLAFMSRLMQRFGAIEAINLDSSGSAHVIGPGFESVPSDMEGPRPIASIFGIDVGEDGITWPGYAPPQ